MAFASGMSEALYVGFETSFKILPGTFNAYKVAVINPRFTPAVGRFTSNALTGLAQPRSPAFGKQGLDWSMEVEGSKENFAPFLRGHFGAPLADQGYAGPPLIYDHYFGFAAMPSLAIEERHTDISKNFARQGAYAGSMDMTCDAEGLNTATFGGIGAFQTNESSATIINGTITDLSGSLPFNLVAGTVKVGGTAAAYIQQVSIRSNRGLDKRNHIDGTNQVGVVFSQIPTVELGIRASFQDTDLLDKSINNTETSLELFILELNTGYGLKIYCPTIVIRPGAPETAGTGLANINLTADAYARGSASDIAGEILGKYIGTGTITGLNTKTLVAKADAFTDETFTFTSTEETGLAAVVTKINATAVNLTADQEMGRLRLSSKTKGTSSKIRVNVSSTSLALLGFTASVDYTGFASQSIVARLTNATATVGS